MKTVYRYIFQFHGWSGENSYIAVYNQRRKPNQTQRKYKYSARRYKKLRRMMSKLFRQGYAAPDFTMGQAFGVYPEHRDEDPTLTQAEEWPYK